MKLKCVLMVVLLMGPVFGAAAGGCVIRPENLRVEHMLNPPVIEPGCPRLEWINAPVSEAVVGASQQAYRIIVSSTQVLARKKRGDVWDSGKVVSANSTNIRYGGEALKPGHGYWWRVQVWDNRGKRSGWSDVATFVTGLRDSDWTARWIGSPLQGEEGSAEYCRAPKFSKSFEADTRRLVSARAFTSGLGYFEMFLNGERVGDDRLVPNFTNYGPRPGLINARLPMEDRYTGSRVLYLAYDLMPALKNGENLLEATVGNGFYNSHTSWVEAYGSPRFLCQIELTYADGSKRIIATDESWTATPSPILFNDVYGGEIYDATASGESAQAILREAPEGELTAHASPTDKVLRRLSPVGFTRNGDGSYEVDFGEEISGWVALSGMKGNRGDTVNVTYHCESPLGVHRYIMDGSGDESYAPSFTWYVFSRATISGLENLDPSQVVAEWVGTDVPVDAEFRSSDPFVDRLVEIWQRTQTDNMHGGVASDCPHRERNPYTGDGQVASAMVMANFDAAAFYEKWIRDMRDAQHPVTGYVPNSAPWEPGCGGGVPWGAAMNIIPWEHYMNYGDPTVIEENYEAMKRQTDHMLTWITPEGTMMQQKTCPGSDEPFYWFNLGDWSVPDGMPSEELVHTFYLWMCADITAQAARTVGNGVDAAHYAAVADRVRTAFHNRFYQPGEQTYGKFGSNVFALVMGVPDEVRPGVVEALRREIDNGGDPHLNTGIFGTRYLFTVLAENGLADLAYRVLTSSGFPGYRNWVDQGATTMWEQWDGGNSHNHPMFGGGLVWLYRNLAGISYDPGAPGFRHVTVRPVPVGDLSEIHYAKQTPLGRLASSVTYDPDGNATLRLTVPVGATATVALPGAASPVEVGQGIHTFDFFVGETGGIE